MTNYNGLLVAGFRNPAWHTSGINEVLDVMNKGELVDTCEMRTYLEQQGKEAHFRNEVHCGVLQYGDRLVKIAYKPKDVRQKGSIYAEMIAYEVYEAAIALFSGHHFVPPTVIRKMPDGRAASCQYFVETDPDEDMWDDAFRIRMLGEAPPEELNELAVWNSVFNNWDRHPGNYLATYRDARWYLASIDNEAIEHHGALPEWGMRNFVAAARSYHPQAQITQQLYFPSSVGQIELEQRFYSFGFSEPKQNLDSVCSHLRSVSVTNPSVYIKQGFLMVSYHEGSHRAFPLPHPPYSEELISIYRNLDEQILGRYFQPFSNLSPWDARTRIQGILERRDQFLDAALKESESEGIYSTSV